MYIKKNIKEAILIRRIEETFLDLFSTGKLNGTVHTCIGQEFSALAFAGQLLKDDFIFSNHRCHGHYLAFLKDYKGLIAELIGKKNGVCAGIGSSQHLCNKNFYSNGIQGGIVPVAAGLALANKFSHNNNIGIVFIGDGTLGEGIVYETMNLISLLKIPLIIVCENNQYSQSTPSGKNFSGDILTRVKGFNISTYSSDTWNIEHLMINAKASIDFVRKTKLPAFHLINTYRLKAHSKGDDFRNKEEIRRYELKDPINIFKNNNRNEYFKIVKQINKEINSIVSLLDKSVELTIEEYIGYEYIEKNKNISWRNIEKTNTRQVVLINDFFKQYMSKDKKLIFIGEDVLSPYGGAFKVANELSELYPEQVITTPLSEAAIVGMANGLALSGYKPFVEIMFGDFITLILDQLINHASKFFHMYNKQNKCPIVIRTPMGGGRGYGPTHSQTLDKFLVGIDNIKVIALNTLVNPKVIYNNVYNEKHPIVVIENKLDYGKKVGEISLKNYSIEMSNSLYPLCRIKPISGDINLTIVTYGGMVDIVTQCVYDIFVEYELLPEIIVLTKICPIENIDYDYIIASVAKTGRLVFIEEGKKCCGIGSEVIAYISENISTNISIKRIAAMPYPIPAVESLEKIILPGKNRIINEIKEIL